ncbi:SusF/SusE family outer membrane protein [Marinilabilia salmonicolor]|uniref:SusF/SusE family outer membrane protein n=1 Tax=Marinilabilia salmonicolor TaxID=989 RepID=UPI00029A93A8|nr:SusF/SusE family outer membrane protein [Marinilabilia salmonicolor]
MKIKNISKWLFLTIGAVMMFSSCEEDKDYEQIILNSTKDVPSLDGMYIIGSGIVFEETESAARLRMAKNEVLQEERASLFEIYIAVKQGQEGFNILTVEGADNNMWGPGDDFAEIPDEERHGDEPKGASLRKGSLVKTSTAFTVPNDGLYHVVFDEEVGKVSVSEVKWGLIGDATPGGWSGDTELTMETFSLDSVVFRQEGVELLEGTFKLRYSGGWKIFLDEELDLGEGNKGVTVNTNFGGSVDELESGGDNFSWSENGIYTVKYVWNARGADSFTTEKTADVEVAEYPETLFMVGDALNMDDSDSDGTPDGWQWDLTDAPMVPVNSHPNMFWKIVWLEGGGNFKFAPQREWKGDFGAAEDLGNGEYSKGSDNIVAPAESGYYMVVVDLDAEKISVQDPEIYLIGDAIGSWDGGNTDYLFTVDNANEVITYEGPLLGANLRMYAGHSYFEVGDWWQSEFMIYSGNIEFRGTGGDQEPVAVEAGTYKIDLNFKDSTGSITLQ